MTQGNNDIEELRERIKELEQNDLIFARRSNTLLDEILITNEHLDRVAERLDQMAERQNQTDNQLVLLAERFDIMVNSQIALQENVNQLTVLWTGLAHQAEQDRAVMLSILEYLRK